MRRVSILGAATIGVALCLLAVHQSMAASKANKLAEEAISALRGINSALKVGVNIERYNDKVVDAQTKVDNYVTKIGTAKYGGFGAKQVTAQNHYVDAGDLWQWSIDATNKYPYIPPSTTGTLLPIYTRCIKRYPQIGKMDTDGGAMSLDEKGDKHMYVPDAEQIIWKLGVKAVSSLKPPP